jgi:hypothetical protein
MEVKNHEFIHITKWLSNQLSFLFKKTLGKKRDLDVSSVPAHDDECNCTEAN